MTRRFCLLLLALSIPAAAADLTGEFERTLTVSGPVELQIGSGSGSIVVREGSSDRVRVRGRFRTWGWLFWSADPALAREIEQNPPIRQTGNRIVIGTDVRNWNRVGISYEVETPADTRLRVTTGSGSLDVSGVRGPANLSTGSGSITVARIGGGVEATTGSGSIRVDGADGPVTGTTGSGGITISDAGGDVDITAGSGSLRVTSPRGAVRARTGSGGIRVEGAGRDLDVHAGSGSLTVDGDPGSARWRLETASGGVNLRLPPRSSFELDARSGSGGVSTKHSITNQGSVRRGELRGTAGTGVAQLYIRTGSGSIQID